MFKFVLFWLDIFLNNVAINWLKKSNVSSLFFCILPQTKYNGGIISGFEPYKGCLKQSLQSMVYLIWIFTSRGGAPASTSGNEGLTFNNNDYNVQGVCLSGEVLWTPTILWVDLFLRGNHSLRILNTTRKINNSFFKVFPINQGTWYWSRDFANDVFYVQIMTLFW